MEASNYNASVTRVVWDAGKTYDLCHSAEKTKCSGRFSLKNEPSAEFSLFVDCTEGAYKKIKLGIVAENIDENNPVIVGGQFWVCDSDGDKTREYNVEKITFDRAEQRCEFGTTPGEVRNFFKKAYFGKLGVSFCFKFTTRYRSSTVNPNRSSSVIAVPDFNDSLVQKLRGAYEEGFGFDTIIVAGGKEFKVLRGVLILHSSVFQNMFLGNLKEVSTVGMEINDVSADTTEAFIKWMYTGEILENVDIEELFMVADKYIVEDLKAFCVKLMLDTLTEQNAVRRLVLAAKHNVKNLEQQVLKFIHEKGPDFVYKIMQSKTWHDYLNLRGDS